MARRKDHFSNNSKGFYKQERLLILFYKNYKIILTHSMLGDTLPLVISPNLAGGTLLLPAALFPAHSPLFKVTRHARPSSF